MVPARQGYIGWRNSFLRIDSWAPYTFKNTGSDVQIPEGHDVSKECIDIIRRMLAKRPQDRITLQEIKVKHTQLTTL
jgi:serine/threonine protein kinase